MFTIPLSPLVRFPGAIIMIPHLKPIFNLFLLGIFIRIFNEIDTLMIGYLSTESEVGLYSASYKISSVLSTLILSATTVVLPRMAYEFEKRESDKANEILKTSVQYIWMIGLPLAVGACIYSKDFISILSGGAFVQATASSRILSIRILLSPINAMFLLHYLVPRGNEKEEIIITSVAALGNIMLNACLIPSHGAVGASMATVAAEAIEFIVMSKYITRYMKFSELNKTLYYFNLMLPLYSENIVLSEELWNKHGIEGQYALTHLANLYGGDQLNMSNTIAISLRNAAKKNNSNYSIRGKIDLFLRLEDNENGKV